MHKGQTETTSNGHGPPPQKKDNACQTINTIVNAENQIVLQISIFLLSLRRADVITNVPQSLDSVPKWRINLDSTTSIPTASSGRNLGMANEDVTMKMTTYILTMLFDRISESQLFSLVIKIWADRISFGGKNIAASRFLFYVYFYRTKWFT